MLGNISTFILNLLDIAEERRWRHVFKGIVFYGDRSITSFFLHLNAESFKREKDRELERNELRQMEITSPYIGKAAGHCKLLIFTFELGSLA